jgi:hypothetical protein
MKTTKNPYQSPQIIEVQLDSEISLVLVSNPPDGPDETKNQAPEYFDNDPSVTKIG